MNIGNRINELRKKSNITMQQLSALTGISQPVLSKLETGNRVPDVPTLQKICEALNVPLSDFFSDNNKYTTIGKELDDFLRYNGIDTSSLSEEKKKQIGEQFAQLYLSLMKND